MAVEHGPVAIPEHFFRALCQDANCRTPLGGFHIPAQGGMVVFICPKCQKVSVFRNEMYGISAALSTGLRGVSPSGKRP